MSFVKIRWFNLWFYITPFSGFWETLPLTFKANYVTKEMRCTNKRVASVTWSQTGFDGQFLQSNDFKSLELTLMSRYPARVDGLSGRCFVQEDIVSIIRTTPSLQSKENKNYKPSYFSLGLKSVESGNYKKSNCLLRLLFFSQSLMKWHFLKIWTYRSKGRSKLTDSETLSIFDGLFLVGFTTDLYMSPDKISDILTWRSQEWSWWKDAFHHQAQGDFKAH